MTGRWLPVASVLSLLVGGIATADDIDFLPPASYYSGATGTGATLKSQLTTAMSAGHILQTYGNFRFIPRWTDTDPNTFEHIILAYDRASVSQNWDNGVTWNREHVWPVSRQPGSSPGNSDTGHLADPHSLRPADSGINSSRGNDPFGLDNTTGSYGHVGSYFYPGDADAGDIARSIFYQDTRWGPSQGLSIVDSFPSGNQMGDLSSMLVWHYRDVPDTFERRRNQFIYSDTGPNLFYSNNRNAYVDHPEFVWSVYVDQNNDSQLYVGGSPNANGSSSVAADLGSVIVGASAPGNQNVTLNRNGMDGTYYEVTTSGGATSSITGRHNAFPINATGTDSTTISVGLSGSTASAGQQSGSVVIDNLDVTTGEGSGYGDLDGNDTINVSFDVLDHSEASFEGLADVNSLLLDFGTVVMGSSLPDLDFDIFNLEDTAGFTADLELDSISGSGDTSVLTTDLTTFTGGSALEAGFSNSFMASMDTSTLGSFSATYTLSFSDEDIPGAATGDDLTLTLMGSVIGGNADFDGSGLVDGRDFVIWQQGFGNGTTQAEGDADGNNQVDEVDLMVWQSQFGTSPITVNTAQVPEPASALLFLVGVCSAVTCRQRR